LELFTSATVDVVQLVLPPGTPFVEAPPDAVAKELVCDVSPFAATLGGGACPHVFTSTVTLLELLPEAIVAVYTLLLVVLLPPLVVVVDVTRYWTA
jgi:hypothetical protein